MTPDPTLTDEELAKLELRFMHVDHIRRLIAALRASRDEVERLRAEASEWRRRIVP